MKNNNKWDALEESNLLEQVDFGMCIEEISEVHQRTHGAILARLSKLNVIDPKLEAQYRTSGDPKKPTVLAEINSLLRFEYEQQRDLFEVELSFHSGFITHKLYSFLLSQGIKHLSELRQAKFNKLSFKNKHTDAINKEINAVLSILDTNQNSDDLRTSSFYEASALAFRYLKNTTGKMLPNRKLELALSSLIRESTSLLEQVTYQNEHTINDLKNDYRVNQETAELFYELFNQALRTSIKLPERSIRIFQLRLGLSMFNEPFTLEMISKEFSVTGERIRQLFVKACDRIVSQLKQPRDSKAKALRDIIISITQPNTEQMSSLLSFCHLLVENNRVRELASVFLAVSDECAYSEAKQKLADIPKPSLTRHSKPKIVEDFDWNATVAKGVLPATLSQFDSVRDITSGKQREVNRDGLGNAGIYFSKRFEKTICYESNLELSFIENIDHLPNIIDIQEQPVSYPYELFSKTFTYTPDFAVLDNEGKLAIVEIKPNYEMLKIRVLSKALLACSNTDKKGLIFIICDDKGNSYIDIAKHPVSDSKVAHFLAHLSNNKHMSYQDFKDYKHDYSLTNKEFSSIVVRHDLAVGTKPFSITYLPEHLSFKRFLR